MNLTNRTRIGIIAGVFLIGGVSVHGYVGTNSIRTTNGSTAGFGTQTVQKLNVTDIDVGLNPTNKNLATNIVFTVPPVTLSTAGDTTAWMEPNGSGTWTACGPVSNGTTMITCPYSGAVDKIGVTSSGARAPLQLVTAD